ncbi:endonuclease/exonuclease/phosphatase family protein [Shewanella maritima]|uniref:endonuclease/exonuclease/phosphatase family protein n=1 Tax=Shewanella maritima TaxID=2520507 RepID=UPI003736743A
MKLVKTIAATAIGVALLTGCNDETNVYPPEVEPTPTNVRFAAFNLSFDRNNYEDLVAEMRIKPAEQQVYMDKWFDGTLTEEELAVAKKIIQIRNVAGIIQTERPAVLQMGEFNNEGLGEDFEAIQGFRLNYLSVPQKANGATSDGDIMLEPINFSYFENFATNTGLLSDFDLDRNGEIALPGDAWGFGFYHGQYAFGLLSQYPIDKDNIRTFQNFKWKDMPGETNPTIVNCDRDDIPEGMACGDEWYTAEAWAEKPMSSKNHVDVPVIIPTEEGNKTVHLLMSHPTPPIFDTLTENNKMLNRAEIKFWNDYISGNGGYIYDDNGGKGGIVNNASFVIMGDLNADPVSGDGFLDTIKDLMNSQHVNYDATFGIHAPKSIGGPECLSNGECRESNWSTPYPDMITSVSGLRLDHVIPSVDLKVIDSGVYWPASFEDGRLFINDERVGGGTSKDLSSDHRLLWVEVAL